MTNINERNGEVAYNVKFKQLHLHYATLTLHRVKSVSYTHLDVYKRQVYTFLKKLLTYVYYFTIILNYFIRTIFSLK